MNNKGFAVSSVLYAILISFLLFLGVALAMFSSANNITLSANEMVFVIILVIGFHRLID